MAQKFLSVPFLTKAEVDAEVTKAKALLARVKTEGVTSAPLPSPAIKLTPVTTPATTSVTTSKTLTPTFTKAPLPESFYESARGAIASGALQPGQALSSLQAVISTGQFSGQVDPKKLFAPGLNIQTSGGRIADFQPDFSGNVFYKTPEVKTSVTGITGEPTTPRSVFDIPSVSQYMQAVGAKPDSQTKASSQNEIAAQVARAKAMVAQTEAEGEKPFAGSAFEAALNVPRTPTAAGAVTAAGLSGISATDTLRTLGISAPSESEMFEKVMSSPEFKLFQKALGLKTVTAEANVAAAKDLLESKYESDKNTLEQNLAERGLAFSGIRGAQVKALSDSLTASKLGEDRKLAAALLDADIDLRTKVISQVATLIKDAFNQQKDAIDQLNKAGYALIGTTLVPTTEALRISQQAGNEDFDRMVALKRLDISYQLANTASERNSILNQIREVTLAEKTAVTPGQYVNAATNLPVKLTEEARQMLQRSETIADYYSPTLLDMLKGVETGSIAGRVAKYTVGMPIAQYFRDEDLSMFNAMASYFSQQIVYMNSGKQINPEEMKQLYQSLPDITFSVSENKKRVEQFTKITKESYGRYLTGNGLKKYTGPATYSGFSPNVDLAGSVAGAEEIDLSDLDFTF